MSSLLLGFVGETHEWLGTG